eukprot:12928537-Prorocentrum_lima.AAC.1
MGRQKDETERLQLVEHRLMHDTQDTVNRIALEQPRTFYVVAHLQAGEELQEATKTPPRHKG